MKTISTLIIALFFIFSSVFAQKNTAKLISSNENETVLSFKLNSFKFNTVETQNGEELRITADNLTSILEKGAPNLPKFTKSIIIPDKGNTKIAVIYSDFYEVQNIKIAPSKGNFTRDIDPATVPYEYGKAYTKNSFFPNNLTKLNKPYIIRDFRGQAVHVYPFSYNPVTNILRVYKEITVKISYLKEKGENEFTRTKSFNKLAKEFKNIYSSHFINYTSQIKYTPVEEDGNMLIICYDDWTNDVQPLVNWKNKIGRPCEMVTVTQAGGTANAIKTYVQNYYNTNGLTFLLLVGDSQQVPTLSSNGDSDNAYAYVTGNDHYLEFFVGRFSAETQAHVQTQVARTITYENGNTLASGWLNKTMGVASALGAGQGDDDEADFEHVRNMQTDFTNFTYVTPTVEQFDGSQGGNDAAGNPTSATVSAELNSGVGNALYCGHGGDFSWVSSGFDVSDINNLTNDNKLPFIFDVACVNGNFVGQTCFAEAWLRAENGGQPTGAIAICASTINQDWAQPMVAQDEMVDILVESYANNIKRTFTGVAVNGMFLMNDETSDWAMTDTWTTFGDPSVMLRTDDPANMNITHASAIIMGQSSFTINCDFDGALACLSKDGVIIGTATVTGGTADVAISGLTPGDIVDVAVTGFNKTTYLSTVNVIAPNGPYVSFDELQIGGESTINFGQTGNLDITLKNFGPDDATGVTATVTTSDTYVTSLTNNTNVSFGNIAGNNGTATSSGSFTIELANDVPDQHIINFSIEITSTNKTTWNGTFNLTVNAPTLSIANLTIANDGNSDGTLDPGETGDLVFSVSNTGHADAVFNGTLSETSDPNNYLTLNTTSVTGTSISAGASADFSYSATADATTPLGSPVSVKLDVADDGTGNYTESSTQEFNIGIIPIYPISDEGTLTVCTGTFYDSGLETGDYGSDEDYTMTFLVPAGNDDVIVEFTSFDIESGYDYLHVYDGADVSAPEISGSPFSGTNSPGTLMGANGLTFRFTSDNYVQHAGWVANVSCYTATTAPDCVTNPVPFNGATAVFPTQISWDASLGASSYDVYFGTDADPYTNTATTVTNTFMNITTASNTTYYWAVLPTNNVGTTSGCEVFSFTTGDAQYYMSNSTVVTCSAAFYDTGGPSNNYSSSEDLTMTFMPEVAGNMISAYFNSFDVEIVGTTQYDYLEVYDGTDATATFIGKFSADDGAPVPSELQPVTATNTDGALTFVFHSDNSVTRDGWDASITCIDPVGVNTISSNEISIFPNPANGIFSIDFGNLENAKRIIEVYSINGQLIYQTNKSDNVVQIDLSNNSKGIYFIKIKSNNKIFTDKLILK